MAIFLKVLASVGAWFVLTVLVAIGFELAFVVRPPVLTTLTTYALLAPALFLIWRKRAKGFS